MQEIYKKIQEERDKQDAKWGIRDQHPSLWLTILTEEVGEVAEEICESNFDVNALSDNYEKELVQVAAVTVAMLENHLRNKNKNKNNG